MKLSGSADKVIGAKFQINGVNPTTSSFFNGLKRGYEVSRLGAPGVSFDVTPLVTHFFSC